MDKLHINILIILLHIFYVVRGQMKTDLDIVVSKDDNFYNYTCLFVGDTLATALALNIRTGYFNSTSNRVDGIFSIKPLRYDFNMDHVNSTMEWRLKRSDDLKLEALSDTRWEDLPIKKIKHNKYLQRKIENGDDFIISFSARVSRNIEILICNGGIPSKNDCYWILINTYDLGQSVIKTCLGGILYCANNRAIKKKQVSLKQAWNTFTVTGSKDPKTDSFQLEVYELGQTTPFLELDNMTVIKNLSRVRFGYYDPNDTNRYSYWKFHDYSFAYTNETNMTLIDTRKFWPKKTLCISMTFAMCDECTLDLIVNDEERRIETKNLTSKLLRWQTVNEIFKDHKYLNYKIYIISSLKSDTDAEQFWAVGNIRQCSTDFRDSKYITGSIARDDVQSAPISCQVLSPAISVRIDPIEEHLPLDEVVVKKLYIILAVLVCLTLLLIVIVGCITYSCSCSRSKTHERLKDGNTTVYMSQCQLYDDVLINAPALYDDVGNVRDINIYDEPSLSVNYDVSHSRHAQK